jgi:hypothetical protein
VTEAAWSTQLSLLQSRGVTLKPGLTAAEIQRVEEIHRFRFPPDLRSLLSCALPIGPKYPGGPTSFPDWRSPESVQEQLDWPFEGIAFDIEHAAFWWEPWGPRPAALSDAIAVARAAVDLAPRLIPIMGHRYLPAEPEVEGNPVFSVYQTDIVFFGADLRRYLACEFARLPWADAVRGDRRRIRFWTDLVESLEPRHSTTSR